MKYLKLNILFLLFLMACEGEQKTTEFKGKTITFPSKDGLTITADLYKIDDKSPYILLFHQAGFSRGSYREIAPKLNQMGFNCLAIDQRSGEEANGVTNETNQVAQKQNKGTEYPDALLDLEAAYDYAKNELKAEKLVLWGSSYSASLVLYLANQYKGDITGVLAFSPGEYFELEGKNIASHASQITNPVFITSAKDEKGQWQGIYDNISSEKVFFLPESEGFHGSKALWEENEGSQEYWVAVKKFLTAIKN